MYCCGPTVYNFLHVGNFRGPVFYNFVKNWLEHSGYKVTFVYNFTDVDDKILNRAKEEGVEPSEISEKYIAEFKKDIAALGLKPHDRNPKVTEHMQDIIDLVQTLVDKGHAYVADDGEVLYSVQSFAEYGKLSGRKVEDSQSGSRIEVDPKKKDAADFALWKPAKEGEQGWDSPWCRGRPGWHIECSAMIRAIFGDQIDIHGGGIDLVFPHHENEIAQGEGASGGKKYCGYWVHNNFINFGGQKMSKSLGNVKTMREFLGSYHPEIFKYLVIASHYRSELDFSDASVEHAVRGLARVYSALAVAEDYLAKSEGAQIQVDKEFEKVVGEFEKEFEKSINDDFATPKAIGQIYDLVRHFNSIVKRGAKAKPLTLGRCQQFTSTLNKYGEMMALFAEPAGKFLTDLDNQLLSQKGFERSKIDGLVEERRQARADKNFERSDELRQVLTDLGIEIQDLPDRTYWEVQK